MSTVIPKMNVVAGNVRVELGGGSYLEMTPESAQSFARSLIAKSLEAQGEKPTHLAIIPLGGDS